MPSALANSPFGSPIILSVHVSRKKIEKLLANPDVMKDSEGVQLFDAPTIRDMEEVKPAPFLPALNLHA